VRKKIIGVVTAAGVAGSMAAATLVGGAGAGASTQLAFFATASGSLVRAFDNTITSDLSAESTISTFNPNLSTSNTTASVTVSGLGTVNGIATSAASSQTLTTSKATAKSQIANVNLLGGAITIQGVTTTAYSQIAGGVPSSAINTQFVGLHIAGVNLPLNIPKNYNVTIPGLASIALNASNVITVGGVTAAMGGGMIVTLLKPVGNNQAGATIDLAPVMTRVGDVDYENTGHTSMGSAYASKVNGNVGDLVGIRSDPTALVSVQPGKTTSVSSAAVNLSSLLRLGALYDTATGEQSTARGYAELDSKIAGINLFGGAITADGVEAHARVNAPTNEPIAVSGFSTLTNLKINGSPIAVNPAPNTQINLLNVAIITLNQQIQGPHSIVVRAIDIKITTDAYGLKAGTEVQLAAAGASAT
jgi:hypothetical protein